VYTPGDLAMTFASLDVQWQKSEEVMDWPQLPGSGVFARQSDHQRAAPTSADRPAAARTEDGGSGPSGLRNASRDASSAADRPLSRVTAIEDWEIPEWSRFLDPSSSEPSPPAEVENHDPGLWERTHLLFGLDRNGKLTAAARVLVAATMPDEIVATLSELVGRVEVIDLNAGPDRSAQEARLYWSNGALYARDRLVVHDRRTDLASLDLGVYDAVLFPHCSLFRYGVSGMADLLRQADRLLGDGGLLVFKAEILAGTEPSLDHLDAGIVGPSGLAERIESLTGFAIEGGFDALISPRTAQCLPPNGRLLQHLDGRVAAPSLWFLVKQRPTPAEAWRELRAWHVRRLLGDQIHRLKLGPAGRRDDRGRIATKDSGKGLVFFGPHLKLPAGGYEAVIGIESAAGARGANVMLEVIGGTHCLERRKVRPDAGSLSTVRIPFAIPSAGDDELQAVEVRARSAGGTAIFTECRLIHALS
jgi:hypothetical protein